MMSKEIPEIKPGAKVKIKPGKRHLVNGIKVYPLIADAIVIKNNGGKSKRIEIED